MNGKTKQINSQAENPKWKTTTTTTIVAVEEKQKISKSNQQVPFTKFMYPNKQELAN